MGGKISFWIYEFFGPLCHQESDRCFFIFGNKYAVCSRCFSVYTGFFAGTLLYPMIFGRKLLKMPGLIFFITAVVLLIADVLFDYLNYFPNTFLSRSISGGVVGLISAFYIVPGLMIFVLEMYYYIEDFKTRK